jgi:hypothetical protein
MSEESKPRTVPVTVDNFIRAETDWAFDTVIRQQEAFGKFNHAREVTTLDQQAVPRCNRDALYSTAVFDLDAAAATITLPDAGRRFMTMIVINEDHYVYKVFYSAGACTFTREQVGTRYALMALRTLVDPANAKDVEQAHALQDAVTVSQKSPGRFEVPNWDHESRKKVREALKTLGAMLPDLRHAFGAKDEVDPVRHLIATATAWGGNPDRDAIYLNVTPNDNDGKTIYTLNVKDVPVDAFWSVTVYNREGYLQPNALNRYNLNNLTAQKDADGSTTVQFGGCDGKTPNCLPIMKGWNYMVRLYRPRAEILSGKWSFPEAKPKSTTSQDLGDQPEKAA